ncbi:MAG: sulfatase-like hydrolase/transferase [Planctomycetaceae bacterium]|nr:sulfatase-like hydrolase/transferase [Planctomycetaceae bacterium]
MNRTFAAILFAVCVAGNGSLASAPNVLLIVTDDQRPDTIHALGNEVIQTPALDDLVARGTTFTRAITAIPICVASRAELLTGRDGRFNGQDNFGFSPKPGVPHLANVLRDQGYETCYVGKWHTVGRPSDSGYETTEGLYGSGGGKYPLTFPLDWKGMEVTGYRGWVFQTDDRTIFPDRGVGLTPNISENFTDAALAFLKRRSERPFFLHVNYTAPHDPLFVPKGFETRHADLDVPLPKNFVPEHPFDHGNAGGRDEVLFSSPRTPEQTKAGLAVYYAVIEHLDQQVGRLLEGLQADDLSQETLVIYTSDHGLAMGSHGLRGKQNMYEHSVGVPLLFAGSDVPAGKRTDAQCYLRDLFPTICDYAGAKIPETVHGKSLKPVIEGTQETVYDAVFAHYKDSQQMVRTEHWKYVRYPLVDREQLFDLRNEPLEMNNLIQNPEHATVADNLRSRLNEWKQESLD